jgi:hypothetical protein
MHAGIVSDRFARFNHGVKLAQHKAQLKMQGKASDVAHFDHSLDFIRQLQVNRLCQELGLHQPYPFLDPSKLQDPEAAAAAADNITSEQEEDDAAADDVSQQQEEEGGVGPADWDEDVLLEDMSDDSLDGDAAAEAEYAAAWQQQQQQQPEDFAAPVARTRAAAATAAAAVVAEQDQSLPNMPSQLTPYKRCASAAASAGASSVSPRARLARSAAAGVAKLVADSDEECQPAPKRRHTTAAESDSYSGEEGGTDLAMEDVPVVQSTPRKRKKQQQKQSPSWLTERVATRLAAGEVVGEVHGAEEEDLFMQLLPHFVAGSSSSISPLRMAAGSVDFKAMADGWNARVPGYHSSGRQCSYKQVQQLKTHFSKVSSEARRSTARHRATADVGTSAAAFTAGPNGNAAAAAATAQAAKASLAAAAAATTFAADPSGNAAASLAAAAAAAASDGGTPVSAELVDATAVGVAAAAGSGAQAVGIQPAWQSLLGGANKPGSSGVGVSMQPTKGQGKGGAGAKKKCVPCTLKSMKQLVTDGKLPPNQALTQLAAKTFSGGVQNTAVHIKQCPFCKCQDCQKFFSKRGSLNPDEFTLKTQCQGSGKKRS